MFFWRTKSFIDKLDSFPDSIDQYIILLEEKVEFLKVIHTNSIVQNRLNELYPLISDKQRQYRQREAFHL
jgi:hypothetical protein